MLRTLRPTEDPNFIFTFAMCTPNKPRSSPSNTNSKGRQAYKSFARRFTLASGNDTENASKKCLLYTFVTFIVAMFLTIHILTLSGGDSANNTSSSTKGRLRFSSSKNNNIDKQITNNQNTKSFYHSKINSPYEEIWINSKLPGWAKKKYRFRDIEDTIPPEDRICYVHVGKAGGSSVGCGLGFSLHCSNSTQKPLQGLLPQRTTRLFHADTYDCYDDSAYFLFVVRNPVERIKSAFLYDRPKSEKSLKQHYPEYYERRKNYYLDCPGFGHMETMVQHGLKKEGHSSEVCKTRAFTAMRGDLHFSCHMYFNYQFHLEGVPADGKILVIRNEHLVQDWNTVEHRIGGEKDTIEPDAIGVMNKSTKNTDDKYLSEDSLHIVCRQLCNELVSYKKILRRSLNLNYQQIEESIEELRKTCPKYADYEEGDCPNPMPDITDKLINTRGYEDKVLDNSYNINKEKLEILMHPGKRNETAEAEDTMDDDGYSLPYSV